MCFENKLNKFKRHKNKKTDEKMIRKLFMGHTNLYRSSSARDMTVQVYK